MAEQAEAAKLFSVPDFVGDMCKAIASRIRGAVASVSFDDFHKVFKYFTLQLCICENSFTLLIAAFVLILCCDSAILIVNTTCGTTVIVYQRL